MLAWANSLLKNKKIPGRSFIEELNIGEANIINLIGKEGKVYKGLRNPIHVPEKKLHLEVIRHFDLEKFELMVFELDSLKDIEFFAKQKMF